MPRLCYTTDYGRELWVRLDGRSPEVTLGRGCDNTIWLDHPTVSRVHAKMVFFKGRCTVIDMNSMNGMEVNGREVRKSLLKPGDVVKCGECVIKVFPDPVVNVNQGLARLRELLSHEPGERAWRELTEELFAWPDALELELALDYVTQHLESSDWREFACEAPGLWCATLKNMLQRVSELSIPREMFLRRMRSYIFGPYDQRWRVVKSLRFFGQKVGVPGVTCLGMFPMVSELSRLDLGNNQLGDEGVEALMGSPHLKHLKHLDLWSNQLTDAGAEMLAESTVLSGLEVLNLGSNAIGVRGVEALTCSDALQGLRHLNLEQNPGVTGYCGHGELRGEFRQGPLTGLLALPQRFVEVLLVESSLRHLPLSDERRAQCRELELTHLVFLHRGERPVTVLGLREGERLSLGQGIHNHWQVVGGGLSMSHVELVAAEGPLRFEELPGAEGCFLGGHRVSAGVLHEGSFLELGAGWRVSGLPCR